MKNVSFILVKTIRTFWATQYNSEFYTLLNMYKNKFINGS